MNGSMGRVAVGRSLFLNDTDVRVNHPSPLRNGNGQHEAESIDTLQASPELAEAGEGLNESGLEALRASLAPGSPLGGNLTGGGDLGAVAPSSAAPGAGGAGPEGPAQTTEAGLNELARRIKSTHQEALRALEDESKAKAETRQQAGSGKDGQRRSPTLGQAYKTPGERDSEALRQDEEKDRDRLAQQVEASNSAHNVTADSTKSNVKEALGGGKNGKSAPQLKDPPPPPPPPDAGGGEGGGDFGGEGGAPEAASPEAAPEAPAPEPEPTPEPEPEPEPVSAESPAEGGESDAPSEAQSEAGEAGSNGESEAAAPEDSAAPGATDETRTTDAEAAQAETETLQEAAQSNPADPFDKNRTALNEAFKGAKTLDGQGMERLGRMMTQFENRMAGLAATKIAAYGRAHQGAVPPDVSQQILAESQQKVNDTYRHLTENVGTVQGSRELFSQADRASMSENFMFHAADPTTFDQGSNGTCWINSSTSSYGFNTQPDDLARFMKEVSLTGQFNANADGMGNGPRTVQFDKGMFYATGEERNWKISNALNGSARSPVGMFMDEAMTEMVGKHQADAGDYYGGWGARRIMTMISGEAPPEPRGNLWSADVSRQMNQADLDVLLQNGGFQIYSPGHLQSVQFLPDGKYAYNGSSGLTLNGQPMKLDGSDPFKGYITLDNQWGESQDFVTHYVDNGQIRDVQDTRYQHFDAGKVDNERNITLREGNDSNGGGGGGGGGFIDGGGREFLDSLLPLLQGSGGKLDKSLLHQAGGWSVLLKALTEQAEKEVAEGKPGVAYQKLAGAVRKLNVKSVVDPETFQRMERVLQVGEKEGVQDRGQRR